MRALLLLLIAGAVAACASRPAPWPAPIPRVDATPVTAFALQFIDVQVGTGPELRPRQCIYAHYTGWLTSGAQFDSSRDTLPNGTRREPIVFAQGARRVIAGWDAGFEGMRVGGQRRLIIPYQLAYGALGRPPVIPPKATLIFDVQLLAARDTLAGAP
nr:FKBP-type peptidyl-prolyl cis-trans isomerase [Gemmatimonadaceae bacterium]